MNSIITQSPDNRRIEIRQRRNKKVWAGPGWKAARKSFLKNNPLCSSCHSPSQVPHHPDLEVYGKPEYLNLAETKAFCIPCHRGTHTGKYQCPACRKIRSKSEGQPCYSCLNASDKERIAYKHEQQNRDRNRYNHRQAEQVSRWKQAHPRVIRAGHNHG